MSVLKSLMFLSLAFFVVHAKASENEKVAALLEEIWRYELSVSPTLASREGITEYNHLLADISPKALAERHQQFLAFKAALERINVQKLDKQSRINWLMQTYRLDNYISEYKYRSHLVPITSEYGFHASLGALPNAVRFQTLSDYEHYLTRLAAIPEFVHQNIAYMRNGLALGYTQPQAVMKGFEQSVLTYITEDVTKSVFFTPFAALPNALEPSQKLQLIAQAKDVIASHVRPAYQAFYDFLVQEYIPGAKNDIAAKTWPDGAAYYQDRVKHYTTTDWSAQYIHELGVKEVGRIRAEMQAIIDKLEYDGDINAFIHFLRTDSQFYATSSEELIKQASYIAKKMDARLPQLFSYLPRTPYGVAPVPDNIAPKYTTGRYVSPSRDDQPGYYWVNTYALDKRPLYELTALTLHEAVPGHHLQISLAAEMQDLPKVRQNTYISAFGEGWGLYSEYLGIEVGMYDNPYDDFGRLSYEMWRACRLVVDTGMHMFDWSREQAIQYMLTNTALSEHNVTTEIDRYISWPAQALSYKIGEIKIKELRQYAMDELGGKFDVRAFHKAVLQNGSVPLFVLDEEIKTFVTEQKASLGKHP